MKKQEDFVLELAKEVEAKYTDRCSHTMEYCSKGNYDNCNTLYPY